MKFCVATALFASVALTATFDVVSAADKAKNGKKVNNANDRKKGAIPRLNNKAAGAVDDKVLAEDEGYWERFLQDADSSITPPPTPAPTPAPTPPPTPAPTPTPGTCDTEVTTECKITMPDGATIDCKDLPPEGPADCGPKPIEYCYTITNEGDECGDINAILRTRTPPGTTVDLIGLVAPEDRNLCPGDEVVICEADTVDTCDAVCYETKIEVDATMPDGFECNSEDEYEFCVPPPLGTPPPTPPPTPTPGTCDVTVETECEATLADGNTVPCDEINDNISVENCGEVMKEYCYVITNQGDECGEVSTFIRTRTPPGGPPVNLLPGLIASGAQTNLCQGDSIRYCEPMQTIDSCDDQCYLTEVVVQLTMPGGDLCTDDDTYELCVNPGCIVETDITCTLADGSGTSCEEGFPPISVEDCGLVPVEYCYTIENTGPTCGTINSIVRTRTPPGTPEDILAVLIPNADDRLLCAGESITACETAEVDSCVEQCYITTVFVDAQMADGFVCSADDEYEFCVPPPTESPPCNVEVDVSCEMDPSRTIDGSTNCDTVIPIATRCDKRASVLTWRFNGGDCEQSFNIQEADKFTCTDFDGGAPTEGSAWILVTSVKDQEDVYFEGEVRVGDLFSMFAANSNAGKFDADSFFYVYADSSKSQLLQLSSVHTSCSQNLFLKDKFGGVQLLIFENEFGLFTCFVQGTYAFTITNQGSTESGEIVEFTSTTNGITDDCLGVIPEDQRVVPGGGTLDVDKQVLIDMTIRQEYNTLVYIKAETPEGVTCEDTATESFTAGNPALPSFA